MGADDVHRVGAGELLAVAPADVADDEVVARQVHRVVPETNAVAGGGLAGDGDFVFVEGESAAGAGWQADVAGNGEDDGAALGGCGGHGIGEGTGTGGVAVGDRIDIAAPTAVGSGAEAFRTGKGGELGVGSR